MALSTQRNINPNEQEEFLPFNFYCVALRGGPVCPTAMYRDTCWVRRSRGCHGGAGHRLRHRTHSHYCSQAAVVERCSTQKWPTPSRQAPLSCADPTSWLYTLPRSGRLPTPCNPYTSTGRPTTVQPHELPPLQTSCNSRAAQYTVVAGTARHFQNASSRSSHR